MDYKEINIGFGTFKLPSESINEIIKNAIDSGYRLFDTASAYGNEEEVGVALKESGIDREKLFITGKVWNDCRDFDSIVNACKKTIENLRCDYLDLYLVHWPASPVLYPNWIEINKRVWEAMEYLKETGLVKNIGVSNFKKSQLEELLKTAKVKPLINQIEFHIGFMQKETYEYCLKNGINVQAWSPIGGGKILKKDAIKEMANKYNVSPAQICLKWVVSHGVMPIPKGETKEEMLENLSLDFEISKEDIGYLDSLPYLGGSGFDSETITIFG